MAQDIIMVSSDTFTVTYQINPWMHLGEGVNTAQAVQQWQELKAAYQALGARVTVLPSDPNVPDFVFATDGALTIGTKTALANFRYAQRIPEVAHLKAWAQKRRHLIFTPKSHFEGGDVLRWKNTLFMGYGFRTNKAAHGELARFFDSKVIPLELTDPRFYHLDTALAVASQNLLAYYPPAFTPKARATLAALPVTLIEASETEAIAFGLNSYTLNNTVCMAPGAPQLAAAYRAHGLTTRPINTSEFQKSGGGIKCLTNALYY